MAYEKQHPIDQPPIKGKPGSPPGLHGKRYKYKQYVAGKNGWSDWEQPVRKGFRLACCDCGLVHDMWFRLRKNARGAFIQFRARRNNRATAAMRRHKWRSPELLESDEGLPTAEDVKGILRPDWSPPLGEDVGAELFASVAALPELPVETLPPIDKSFHTEELIAGLQKPAMRVDDE